MTVIVTDSRSWTVMVLALDLVNTYILLDVLVCSITGYFYKLCPIFAVFYFPKILACQVFFNLYTAGRNEMCDISTRFARHLYSSKQRVIKCVLGQNTFLLQ